MPNNHLELRFLANTWTTEHDPEKLTPYWDGYFQGQNEAAVELRRHLDPIIKEFDSLKLKIEQAYQERDHLAQWKQDHLEQKIEHWGLLQERDNLNKLVIALRKKIAQMKNSNDLDGSIC